MDAQNFPNITLHPQAGDFLFLHYRTMKQIFGDILGLVETDYLGIALINEKNELLFLSSQPSIEFNIIESKLWQLDAIFHEKFLNDHQAQFWENIYTTKENTKLLYFRRDVHKFAFGLAIPDIFNDFRVVYSFALKSNNQLIKTKLQNRIDFLINMGRFCLKNILLNIQLPVSVMISSNPAFVTKLPFRLKKPYSKFL